MKALLLAEPGRLVYSDLPTAQPSDDEVLIEVRACGICGSDVHGVDGSTGRRRPPVVMGHEVAGVIAEVGATVSGWSQGDRVTLDSTVFCGRCDFCRQGQVNLCNQRRVLGVSCQDYRLDGAFAEYVAVPPRLLYRLPDDLSFEQAVFVEPLSVAVHSVRRAKVSAGETVVVVGTGMIGLLIVQVLGAYGCGRVIGVDVDAERLSLCAQFGAETILGDAEAVTPAVQQRTGGLGADVAIEVVGISAAVETAVASVRKGGRVGLVGNLSSKVQLALQEVVTKELTLCGSAASSGEYPESIELLRSGRVNVGPLIGAVAPLAEGAAWFERLRLGHPQLMKVILVPTRRSK